MNFSLWYAALLSVTLQSPPSADSRHTLMPVPSNLVWREGRFRLDTSFTVTTRVAKPDSRLDRGLDRFRARLAARLGYPVRVGLGGLSATVVGPGEAVQSPEENERYVIEVAPSAASLWANTTVGALRGFETLLQLVESDSAGWYLPAVHIEDTPRFPWRGLLIDVGRHFEPAEVIKRQLDGMAAVKLNVLHWHLSEDQGFRVESKRFPLLAARGSDGLFYTQAQIADIVAYARDRGIRVVPEFDMPGHASAWFVGYPSLASAPGPYAIERRFGVFDPAFDPTQEATYRFLDAFIGEMSVLFPDRYWHIGGDEVAPKQWRNNTQIRAFMKAHGFADNDALQAYFNRRLSEILVRHGKRMVGWDEILHPGLPASTVVQSWRGQASLGEGARKGFSGILSAGWYLDHMLTAEAHYRVDPLPENSGLTAEEAARVLGGEACMWHEHVTQESIDSRIWPRMAAIAERLWSPREVRDVPDMYRRLAVMRVRLEALGLGHESHSPRNGAPARGGSERRRTGRLPGPGRAGELRRAELTPAADPAHPRWCSSRMRRDPIRPRNGKRGSSPRPRWPGDAGARTRLRESFQAWPALGPALAALTARAPLAGDAAAAARALIRVSAIGLEALDQLDRGPAPADWIKARSAALDTLSRPQGLLRITVIPAVRQLVRGAGAGAIP
jgi:hexosaminidase